MLDYLQGGGEGTADEIRKALGKKAADVRAVLKQQAGAGQIQADEQGTRGRPKIIYRALTFSPDEPLRPDPPDEKSQAELIEFDSVTGLGGFSSRNPAPRGIGAGRKAPVPFTGDRGEAPESPLVELDPEEIEQG